MKCLTKTTWEQNPPTNGKCKNAGIKFISLWVHRRKNDARVVVFLKNMAAIKLIVLTSRIFFSKTSRNIQFFGFVFFFFGFQSNVQKKFSQEIIIFFSSILFIFKYFEILAEPLSLFQFPFGWCPKKYSRLIITSCGIAYGVLAHFFLFSLLFLIFEIENSLTRPFFMPYHRGKKKGEFIVFHTVVCNCSSFIQYSQPYKQ